MERYEDNDKNTIIPITDVIFNEEYSHVMSGVMRGEKVMVKVYYKPDDQIKTKNTYYEINMYKQLKKIKCPLPRFDTRYTFWGQPCLVMEKLEPLDLHDKPYKIAIDVLKQLKHFHRIGVHSGIKPANIMKKKNGKYLLIDYGGSTIERLRHGYKRISWSPKWCCQNRENNLVTTYKHDLIELGYTIKALLIERIDKLCKYEPAYDKTQQNIKSGYNGRLDKYMKYVMSLKPKAISMSEKESLYDKLIDILQS
jgi:serine/threonine protein kinase